MTENIESRLEAVEAFMIEHDDIKQKLGEVLQRVHGILHDLTKDLENSKEFDEDLERIETISRVL